MSKVDPACIKRRKRPVRVIIAAAVILIISFATVFAAQDPLLEFIKKINPEARVKIIVDKGYGSRLNISEIDKDIKITVTDVAADDLQTLIQYKVEDLKSGKEYRALIDGIDIKEKWGDEGYICNGVFNFQGKGTLTLLPIDTDDKTIHLSFNKLETPSKESIEGNWSFEIPVKKYHSKTFDINKSVKIGDYLIEFSKIMISPTNTQLFYNFSNGFNSQESIEELGDIILTGDGVEYESNGNVSGGGQGHGMAFESMYFSNPRKIEIKLKELEMSYEDKKELSVDLNKSGVQEFEYLGSKIRVENLRVGRDITFDLYESLDNRQYERLSYSFVSDAGSDSKEYFNSMGNQKEVYYIDKNGTKYEYYDALSKWKEIRDKRPVLNIVKTSWTLHPSEKLDLNGMKNFKISIDGYTKTKYVNKSIKINLDDQSSN
jgi:hypothetical protein